MVATTIAEKFVIFNHVLMEVFVHYLTKWNKSLENDVAYYLVKSKMSV